MKLHGERPDVSKVETKIVVKPIRLPLHVLDSALLCADVFFV